MKIEKKTMKKLLKALIFILAGVTAGYLYYWQIGCVSQTCAITSNPVKSMIFGGIMGVILAIGFWEPEDKRKKNPVQITDEDSK